MIRLQLTTRAFMLLFSTQAGAADFVKNCATGKAMVQVRACIYIIKSGRWQGKRLSQAYNNLAVAYLSAGKYGKAIAGFSKAVEVDKNYANAYFNRGSVYDRTGESGKAIADFSRAIELNPKDAGAYHMRGYLLAGKGKYDQAIADYSRAIELFNKIVSYNPKSAVAYRNRANAYQKTGQKTKAFNDLMMAERITSHLNRSQQPLPK